MPDLCFICETPLGFARATITTRTPNTHTEAYFCETCYKPIARSMNDFIQAAQKVSDSLKEKSNG